MDPGKFQKKVLKLHKALEAGKLDKAASGAAKLSGEDLSHQQRVALMSFQVKTVRMAKKEKDARYMIDNQRELVGKMAPYLAEALHLTHDGQYDDCIPRLKGALARDELADDTPGLSALFPSARNIVHAHLLYSLDERACMKGTNRPTGFAGGEDKKHVLRFWSLPEAYYYLDIKDCPRCGSNIRGGRSGGGKGPSTWHLRCENCGHEWRRTFAVAPPRPKG